MGVMWMVLVWMAVNRVKHTRSHKSGRRLKKRATFYGHEISP